MLTAKSLALKFVASNPAYKASFTPEEKKGGEVIIRAEIKGEENKEFKENFIVLQKLSSILNKFKHDKPSLILGVKDDMVLIMSASDNWPLLILKKGENNYTLLCGFGQSSYIDLKDNSGAIITNELWERKPSNIRADFFIKTLSTSFPLLDVILEFLPPERKLEIIKTKIMADSLNDTINFYTNATIREEITDKHREAIYHSIVNKVKEELADGTNKTPRLDRVYETKIALRRSEKAIFMDYEFVSPEDYKVITVILTPEDIDAFLSFGDVNNIIGAIVDEVFNIVKTGSSNQSIEFFKNYHVLIPNVMANPSIQKLKEYISNMKNEKEVKDRIAFLGKLLAKLKDEIMLIK